MRGVRFAIWLVVAYVAAATLVVFVFSGLSPFVVGVVSQPWLLAILSVACLIGVMVDVRAMKLRWLSVGVSRQTPKTLVYLGEHAWITPMIWGFDTGLIWTTYRVSFTSWILLLMAAVGIEPPWAGAIYGVFFAVPLLALLLVSPHRLPSFRLMSSLIPAQLLGVGSMVVMILIALIAVIGRA
jgi:hypothetical protein